MWRVLSPDGFDIERESNYLTKKEAKVAFAKWAERFKAQGYYSANTLPIPLDELEGKCEFVYEPEVNVLNLKDHSLQEIFDFVSAHLRRQGVPAVAETSGEARYMYRVEDDGDTLMCAVGCMIASKDYRRTFEQTSWSSVREVLYNGNSAFEDADMFRKSTLLETLQNYHDNHLEEGGIECCLKEIAHQYDLEYKEPPNKLNLVVNK